MRTTVIFIVILFNVLSCENREEIQPKNYNLILKKTIIEDFDGFEIDNKGIEIFRNQKTLPIGQSKINLKIDLPKSDLQFFWYNDIRWNQFSRKHIFTFENCHEIWLDGVQFKDSQVKSVLTNLGGIDSVLLNHVYAKLEYSHDLPTYCSEYMIKNPKIGFRRVNFQRMSKGGLLVDKTIQSKYILLNQIVFTDLESKGMINSLDTVYLINKNTDKVSRRLLSNTKVQRFLKHWKL